MVWYGSDCKSCNIACCRSAGWEVSYENGYSKCSGYGTESQDKYYSRVSSDCYYKALNCIWAYTCATKHIQCISKCDGEIGSGVASCYDAFDSDTDQCVASSRSNSNTPSGSGGCCAGFIGLVMIPLRFLTGMKLSRR
ncbi:MAG: hypothetical protein QXS93_00685 [Candidatus Micrarchaeia archaeon]